MKLPLAELFESRHMPISTIGYGEGTVAQTSKNTSNGLMLESGTLELWEKRRLETRGATADQGVESGLSECGDVVSLERRQAQVEERLLELKEDPSVVNDPRYSLLFMFPLMLYFPDHCHMIFGALATAAVAEELWGVLKDACQTCASFLRNGSLKQRYIRTCNVTGRQKTLMLRNAFGPVDFKWEYLHLFLVRFLPLLPVLLTTFDAARILRGLDEKGTKVTTKLVEEVAEVLAIPDLECKLEVLRAVSYAADREGTRLEGCHCHRHLLTQPGPYAKNLAAYRRQVQVA